MTARNKPGVAFWATLVAAVTLPAYIGAYAWLAEPGILLFNDAHHLRHPVTVALPVQYTGRSTLISRATTGREAAIEQLFAPVHWVDRTLWPKRWTVVLGPRD
jgi:hypothetical protein